MACSNHSAPPFLQCMVILEVTGGLGFGLLLQTLFRLVPGYVRFFFFEDEDTINFKIFKI